MVAIRLVQKPQNGKITFDVPDDMRDNLIIIDFQPVSNGSHTATLAEASRALFERLPAPDTDFNWEDINVYEQ